ncbi:hypothetical protein Ciccas_006075 [Cichlidogyrus casuarinus]|uniref:Laminin G domain-containing protein n=1 Tax=Cichlidogyrus casuarinus TaxID=1844966 RepID=A0ABD2Q805_9PLAT
MQLDISDGYLKLDLKLPLQSISLSQTRTSDQYSPGSVIFNEVISANNSASDRFLADFQWHEISVTRRMESIRVWIDGDLVLQYPLSSNESMTSILNSEIIALGGEVRTSSSIFQDESFKGCFKKVYPTNATHALFVIDGAPLDILKFARTRRHNFEIETRTLINLTMVEFSSSCAIQPSQTLSSTLSFTDPEQSFVKLHLRPYLAESESILIEFKLRTNQLQEGLILKMMPKLADLWTDDEEQESEATFGMLALEFVRGDLRMVTKLDHGPETSHTLAKMSEFIDSTRDYPLEIRINEPHTPFLSVRMENVFTCLFYYDKDSKSLTKAKTSARSFKKFPFGDQLFLGGINFSQAISQGTLNPWVYSEATVKRGFTGCISE